LSVGLKSRGSVAGLNGRTTTRAGSGRRCKACLLKNVLFDKNNFRVTMNVNEPARQQSESAMVARLHLRIA
jgi:hypothetical protein